MKNIILITAGYLLSYLWLIMPEGKYFNDPFPFFKFKIPIQNYFDYLGTRLMYVIFAVVLNNVMRNQFSTITLVLFILFAIDFILLYNQPVGWLQGGKFLRVKPEHGFFIPISYSLLMGICLVILTVLAWLKN